MSRGPRRLCVCAAPGLFVVVWVVCCGLVYGWAYTPCVGRVLYRFGLEVGVAGRVLYRGVCAAWLVGGGRREKVLPARVVCVWTGKKFSLLALNGLKWAFFAVWGEFCTGLALRRGLPGEFCTGGRPYGALRVSNGKFQRQ